MAARCAHQSVRSGQPLERRPGAPAQAAAAPQRDPSADWFGSGKRLHARAARSVLEGWPRQNHARTRQRKEVVRQARGYEEEGRKARNRTGYATARMKHVGLFLLL